MKTSITKIANIIVIISLLMFSLFYATKVVNSIKEEDNILSQFEIIEQNNVNNIDDNVNDVNVNIDECQGDLFLNAAYAVILAGLWNAKRILKLGLI
jgi:hypothetical protein